MSKNEDSSQTVSSTACADQLVFVSVPNGSCNILTENREDLDPAAQMARQVSFHSLLVHRFFSSLFISGAWVNLHVFSAVFSKGDNL